MLNNICEEVQINTERTLSKKLGDMIHCVQTLLREKPEATIEDLQQSPELNWKSYQRIVEITDLARTGHQYCCSFKVLRNLTKDKDKIYSFTADTVAANFAV